MKRIEKKTIPPFFQYVLDGAKTYDLRIADFDIEPGDILVLREWDPEKKQYTGREIEKQVTYIGKTKGTKMYSQKDIDMHGFQIVSFK